MSVEPQKFVTSTGFLAYEVLEARVEPATAPSLVLLHNFTSTGRAAWGALLETLNQRYRILLPDLPGHGRSCGYPPAFHHRQMAAQLADLLTGTGFADAHLAGCSIGGMLAQLLVVAEQLRPATLVLVSTTYSLNPATTGHQAALEPANFRAGERWLEATARLHDEHQYSGYFQEVLLPAFRQMNPDAVIDLQLADLARVTSPVCLLHGSEDEFFPPAIPLQMAAAFPNAELQLIEGQSHSLIFRQPWRVAAGMVQFLERWPTNEAATRLPERHRGQDSP
ncbi:MAG: alpha/beta fold hydrolase [Caldilinea sp.]